MANSQIHEIVAEERASINKMEKVAPGETLAEAEAKRMKIKVDGEEKVDDMSLSESDKKLLRAQEAEEQAIEKA